MCANLFWCPLFQRVLIRITYKDTRTHGFGCRRGQAEMFSLWERQPVDTPLAPEFLFCLPCTHIYFLALWTDVGPKQSN